MGRRLTFLLGVLALSVGLFFAWELWVKKPYISFLGAVAGFFLRGGSAGSPVVPVSVSNVVPFLALMLATPGMSAARRLKSTLVGMAIFLVLHLGAVFFYTYWMTHPYPSAAAMLGSLLMSAVQVALPFVVWFVFARTEIRTLAFGGKSRE